MIVIAMAQIPQSLPIWPDNRRVGLLSRKLLSLASALVLSCLLESLLFEVRPTDPAILGAATAVLVTADILCELHASPPCTCRSNDGHATARER